MINNLPSLIISQHTIISTLRMILLVLAISVFNSHLSYSQGEDYVVTLKGDTIKGKLILHIRTLQQSATLKTAEKKHVYKVYQLLGAGKADGTIYHTKKILGVYQFAQLVKPGYLSYYLYTGDETTSQPFSLQVLIKSDGTEKTFSSLVFKKRVGDFLSDCETVKENFDNDLYTRKDLDQLIGDYNDCIAEQTLVRSKPVDHDKMAILKSLQQAVETEKSVKDKKGVLEMLTDVEGKLNNNQPIPGYLVDALRKRLEGHPELMKSLEALL